MQGFDDYGSEASSIHYGMSAREYHSDAGGPRLSQSLATICVNESPLHAWQAHPLLGARPYTYEPNTDDGTLIHSLVLEPESDNIFEIDPSQILTKDGKPAKSPMGTEQGKRIRDAALADGKIPVLRDVLGAFAYKAKAVRSRLADHGIFFSGASEVVIYWTEQGPFGPVRCRCRLDHLIVDEPNGIRIIDLKSTDNANPRELKAICWRKGYDIQRAAYVRAVEACFPWAAGRVDYTLAFVELDKPYAVNPVELSSEFARMGEIRWERGRDRWAECLRADRWTGYAGGTLDAPAWAAAQEMSE